jgi:hypothetical protein
MSAGAIEKQGCSEYYYMGYMLQTSPDDNINQEIKFDSRLKRPTHGCIHMLFSNFKRSNCKYEDPFL